MSKKGKGVAIALAVTLALGGTLAGGFVAGQKYSDNQHSITLAEQKSDFEKVEQSLAKVENELQKQTEECTRLKSQVSSLESEKERLAQENLQKDEQITSLNSQIQNLTEQKTQADNDNAEKQKTITQMQSQVQTLTEEKQKNETEIEELNGQISTLTSSVSDKELQISTLTSQLSQAQSQYAELQETYQQLQSENSNNEEQVNQLTSQVAQLLERISSLESSSKNPIDFSSIGTSGTRYQKQLDDGNYLFSFSDVEGIWLFDVNTKSFERKYETKKNWNLFIQVNGGYLIASYEDKQGILFFDENSKQISLKLDTSGTFTTNKFLTIAEGCVITGVRQTFFFDSESREVSEIHGSYAFTSIHKAGAKYLLFPDGPYGVYWFDPETKTVTSQSSDVRINAVSYIDLSDDRGFLYSPLNSSYSFGLWFFDNKTQEISNISERGYKYQSICEVDGGLLLYDYNKEIYYFDFLSKTIESKKKTTYVFQKIQDAPNGVLLASSSGSFLFYDNATKSITSFDMGNYAYEGVYSVKNGILLYSSKTSGTGILFFNYQDNTLTKICNSGYNWKFVKVGDLHLIAANNCPLMIFDDDTNSLTNLMDNIKSPKFLCFHEKHFVYYTGDMSQDKIALFNEQSKSLKEVYSGNAKASTFYETEKGFFFFNSARGNSVYYYEDSSEQTFEISGTADYHGPSIIKVKGGYLISAMAYASNGGIFYFDEETKSGRVLCPYGEEYSFWQSGDEIICDCKDYRYVYNQDDQTMKLMYDKSFLA